MEEKKEGNPSSKEMTGASPSNVFIEYLKVRHKMWLREVSFEDFLYIISSEQRPFQRSESTQEHPDNMAWDNEATKEEYLRQFNSDREELNAYFSTLELDVPLANEKKNQELIENIAEKMRHISQPIESQIAAEVPLAGDRKKAIIESLRQAYIFALISELNTATITTETEKELLIARAIDGIRKFMFEESVHNAYFAKSVLSHQSEAFEYGKFYRSYCTSPETTLNLLSTKLSVENILPFCVKLSEETRLNKDQKTSIVSMLCKFATSIRNKNEQEKYINVITARAIKNGFGCDIGENEIKKMLAPRKVTMSKEVKTIMPPNEKSNEEKLKAASDGGLFKRVIKAASLHRPKNKNLDRTETPRFLKEELIKSNKINNKFRGDKKDSNSSEDEDDTPSNSPGNK